MQRPKTKRLKLGTLIGLAAVAGIAAFAVHLSGGRSPLMSPALATADSYQPSPQLAALLSATDWLNTRPLTTADVKGKVVLVNFWTYSCINCVRTLPYLRAWAEKYRDHGLVVIGVHTPEFAFEKLSDNVTKALHQLDVPYGIALDSDFKLWRAFGNQGWPAFYFIDAKGEVVHSQLGEGDYADTEARIQDLLKDAGAPAMTKAMATTITPIIGKGVQAAPDLAALGSGETYIGYRQSSNFASPESVAGDKQRRYTLPEGAWLNEWGLGGDWIVGGEYATTAARNSAIAYRFHARDLHLVMAPGGPTHPIRFRVTLDGKAPGADHGADIDADGWGVLNADRLYQLVRQSAEVQDRTFKIEFDEPGAKAYAFTFG